ncbi:hypothetical protein [Clostridium sulfidigenes]|nr:hypothetical protein [Clostridium sulfidigenes]
MKCKDEDIYLWYGNSAKAICGMLHILSMVEGKFQNVYIEVVKYESIKSSRILAFYFL